MLRSKTIMVGDIPFGADHPISFILGPCQLETRDHAMFMAERLVNACTLTSSRFVFKASYDKANRTSLRSERGIGIEDGLKILSEIRSTFGCPVLTDVHDVEQCKLAAEVVDVVQIPAFLSRQTDLLLAAGRTGKTINIKKGQFLAPWEMQNVADKVASTGNTQIMLCERGTSFGYNNLINDFRALPTMAETGYPVIFDATHSVQQPGARGSSSGGQRQFVSALARAACAVGIAGLFIETHQDPDNAPCDGPNMIPIDDMPNLIKVLREYDALTKKDQKQ